MTQPLVHLLSSGSRKGTFKIELEVSESAKKRLEQMMKASGESDLPGLALTALLLYDQVFRELSEGNSILVFGKGMAEGRNLLLKA